MANWLRDRSISARLMLGFGAVILLTMLLTTVVGIKLQSAKGDIKDYRAIARSTNQLGRIQANLLMTRLGVKDFVISASDSAIESVRDRHALAMRVLNDALNGELTDTSRTTLTAIRDRMDAYRATFNEVTELQAERNRLVAIMDTVGPRANGAVDQMAEGVFRIADATAAANMGFAMESIVSARLAAFKFLLNNSSADMEAAVGYKDDAASRLRALRGIAPASEIDATLDDLSTYTDAMRSVRDIILERNDLIQNTLDRIGPEMANLIEELKLNYKESQDTLGPRIEAAAQQSLVQAMTISAMVVILGVAFALIIARSVSRPVNDLTSTMNDLIEGKLDTPISGADSKDEVGEMARAVNVFRDGLVKARALEAEEHKRQKLQAQQAKVLSDAIGRFEGVIGERIVALDEVSTSLTGAADTLKTVTNDNRQRSDGVAHISQQTASNVQSVSAAAEEMDTSFSEIVEQVNRVTGSVAETSNEARKALVSVEELSEKSQEIAEAVDLIDEIANQTNLLALNATIEAARAGDAGKGFAVVASEVKQLAEQAGNATSEIAARTESIRAACAVSEEAMRAIAAGIESLNEVAGVISTAVEQQKLATSEITRNMLEAANGTEKLSTNVTELSQATETTAETVVNVTRAAQETSAQTDEMKRAVAGFIADVKAA